MKKNFLAASGFGSLTEQYVLIQHLYFPAAGRSFLFFLLTVTAHPQRNL
jgi:hypothetical protein